MIIPNTEEKFMRRALQLAACGKAGAAPNPMVGAVVECDGRIIGEGYHIRCGGPHAEVNAINSVGESDRHLLTRSTLYVTLEPCAHYGRTPPCAELIIRTGIPRVVVGCIDPFAKVKGRGIIMLRDAGVEVLVGLLEEECRELNRRFITFHTHCRPYIVLKWACSADGFMDRLRAANEQPTHFSTPLTQMHVHRLRAESKAILVGHTTLLTDRPALTVRHWPAPAEQPLRLLLGRIAPEEIPEGFEAFADIPTLLSTLYERNCQSLLVEGGRTTLQSFIDADLWDEIHEERSRENLGSGVPVPVVPQTAAPSVSFADGHRISIWSRPLKS